MRCINIFSPSLPGYFPARFAGDRSNRLAPVSLQRACTSIFFPVPRGPANRMDLVRGANSCTAGEPGGANKIYSQADYTFYSFFFPIKLKDNKIMLIFLSCTLINLHYIHTQWKDTKLREQPAYITQRGHRLYVGLSQGGAKVAVLSLEVGEANLRAPHDNALHHKLLIQRLHGPEVRSMYVQHKTKQFLDQRL